MTPYREAPAEAVTSCALAWLEADEEPLSRFVDRWTNDHGFGWVPEKSDDRNRQEFMDFVGDMSRVVQAVGDRPAGGEGVPPTVREWLLEHLVVKPCHVTGMHDPTHTPRHFCELQSRALVVDLLGALGVTVADLRRSLHDESCGWCHEHIKPDRRAELERWVEEGVTL